MVKRLARAYTLAIQTFLDSVNEPQYRAGHREPKNLLKELEIRPHPKSSLAAGVWLQNNNEGRTWIYGNNIFATIGKNTTDKTVDLLISIAFADKGAFERSPNTTRIDTTEIRNYFSETVKPIISSFSKKMNVLENITFEKIIIKQGNYDDKKIFQEYNFENPAKYRTGIKQIKTRSLNIVEKEAENMFELIYAYETLTKLF